jgi:ABC-type microcin C transport system permease subunit YejB
LPLGTLRRDCDPIRGSPARPPGTPGLGVAIPSFWLGILLSLFIGLYLKWLPPSGYAPLWPDPVAGLRYLILPALTLGIGISAILTRYMRASLLDVLHREYVATARAKGLRERQVVVAHAVKNALIPVVTVIGLQLGAFMGGAVITSRSSTGLASAAPSGRRSATATTTSSRPRCCSWCSRLC